LCQAHSGLCVDPDAGISRPRTTLKAAMPDPKAHARAAILAGAMTFEPAPLDLIQIRVPAIRRVVDRIEPPLNLAVIPFRYRVTAGGAIVSLRPTCGHSHRR
jgi:hypothetical protein